MERIYLDYAATTPVDPAVFRATTPFFTDEFGNPGSLHSFGQQAIAAVDRSRESLARSLGAEFREIIFTGSATEANNLALRGTVREFKRRYPDRRPQIIVSAVEHESVLETVRDLEREGAELAIVPVNQSGRADPRAVREILNGSTAIVSIMYANNEIGTIQPVKEIADAIKGFRSGGKSADAHFPRFHTDAVQAFQFLDCTAANLGVDLMTLSAHKIYGPKGIGALYKRGSEKDSPLQAIISGGGQEFGLRSGTENVPSIVGFAKAVELAAAMRTEEAPRIAALRDHFWRELQNIFPKAELNGARLENAAENLPNILNIYFPGHQSQDFLTKFDLAGLAVSAGSACRSRAVEASYVLEALGYSAERASASLRVSFGRPTKKEEVDAALRIIKSSL